MFIVLSISCVDELYSWVSIATLNLMALQGVLSERIHLRVDEQTKQKIIVMSLERRMTQKQVVLLALDNLFGS
jgi:hypothetical protein